MLYYASRSLERTSTCHVGHRCGRYRTLPLKLLAQLHHLDEDKRSPISMPDISKLSYEVSTSTLSPFLIIERKTFEQRSLPVQGAVELIMRHSRAVPSKLNKLTTAAICLIGITLAIVEAGLVGPPCSSVKKGEVARQCLTVTAVIHALDSSCD